MIKKPFIRNWGNLFSISIALFISSCGPKYYSSLSNHTDSAKVVVVPAEDKPIQPGLQQLEVIPAGTWIETLEVVVGDGSAQKARAWINAGLDSLKLKETFDTATDKKRWFLSFANAKSIYHQRVLIQDWSRIPGLATGNYMSNGLQEGRKHEPWGDDALNLPASDAANFVEANPVELQAGTILYRVTGGNPAGAYWTLQKPQSVGELIGPLAVRPEWNNFANLYTYTVPTGTVLMVWQGMAASQKVTDKVMTPFLPGGAPQIYIPLKMRNTDFSNLITKEPFKW